ncbi:MAG: efflux RND transporter periplasmic adaptor subunit [Syntrophobacteraceae bacterium]
MTAALSAFEVAKANLAVGKATIVQSRSAIAQAEANLTRVLQNLDYCTIRSPVRGVIIDRRVNIGQTVVSSFNAPSLFLIAKDLKRMQVWVAVNEADIGSITPGQPVVFTVDAYPGETFDGEVGKIRLNATMTQNVVTYVVEVLTDNSKGRLLPYLTANVKFMLNSRKDVLTVPNAVLRWTPQTEQVAPEDRKPRQEQPRGRPAAGAAEAGQGYGQGVVWVQNGNFVSPIPVRVGMSDGTATEIQSDQIKEGIQVVLGEQRKETSEPSQAASPFAPKIFGRGARQ